MADFVRTLGVDLSTDPKRTAAVVVRWDRSSAVVESADTGIDDEGVVALALGVDKAGLDVPFGWPDAFVDFLVAHQERTHGPPEVVPAGSELTLRATDLQVWEATGKRPLSVAADRIASTAVRGSRIQRAVAAAGVDVDRAGSGRLVEVYPAASLRRWGLPATGYKGPDKVAELGQIAAKLRAETPWLDLGLHASMLAGNDDAFDALVASLTARAAALGLTAPPPVAAREQAEREGWIALPTCGLGQLPLPA